MKKYFLIFVIITSIFAQNNYQPKPEEEIAFLPVLVIMAVDVVDAAETGIGVYRTYKTAKTINQTYKFSRTLKEGAREVPKEIVKEGIKQQLKDNANDELSSNKQTENSAHLSNDNVSSYDKFWQIGLKYSTSLTNNIENPLMDLDIINHTKTNKTDNYSMFEMFSLGSFGNNGYMSFNVLNQNSLNRSYADFNDIEAIKFDIKLPTFTTFSVDLIGKEYNFVTNRYFISQDIPLNNFLFGISFLYNNGLNNNEDYYDMMFEVKNMVLPIMELNLGWKKRKKIDKSSTPINYKGYFFGMSFIIRNMFQFKLSSNHNNYQEFDEIYHKKEETTIFKTILSCNLRDFSVGIEYITNNSNIDQYDYHQLNSFLGIKF